MKVSNEKDIFSDDFNYCFTSCNLLPGLAIAKEVSVMSEQDSVSCEHIMNLVVTYLDRVQDEFGAWGVDGKTVTSKVANILEYVDSAGYKSDYLHNILDKAIQFFDSEDILNTDNLDWIFGS